MNHQLSEQLAALTAIGERRGYVLYAEIDKLLPEDYIGGQEINDIFAQLAHSHLDVRETPEAQPEIKLSYGDDMTDPVNLYVREVSGVPRLTREQEIALGRRGCVKTREGDAARKQLIEANLHLVVSLARRSQSNGFRLLTLIEQGNYGLMKAVDEFDPERGYPLSTYAVWWIRLAIRRASQPVDPSQYPHNQYNKSDE